MPGWAEAAFAPRRPVTGGGGADRSIPEQSPPPFHRATRPFQPLAGYNRTTVTTLVSDAEAPWLSVTVTRMV